MSEAEPVPASAPEAAAAAVLDALNATDSNGTEALNATAKFVATPEGTALAYGSLVFMALLPIFFGALRSVTCSKSKVTVRGSPPRNRPRRCGFTSARTGQLARLTASLARCFPAGLKALNNVINHVPQAKRTGQTRLRSD